MIILVRLWDRHKIFRILGLMKVYEHHMDAHGDIFKERQQICQAGSAWPKPMLSLLCGVCHSIGLQVNNDLVYDE